jgi:predicted nucleic acid-binding Zn ribbon protein
MRRPAAIGDLLSAILRGTPAEIRLKEGRIWVVWESAVGSRIALHAQPIAFREGTLTLAVDSAPWMQQLNFLKRELVAKVNGELGEELVKDIHLKAGKIAVAAPVEKPWIAKRRELTGEERALIAEQAAAVSDPELRAVFESIIRKDLENR